MSLGSEITYLGKESLNSGGQQFHQYQLSPQIIEPEKRDLDI
jgi:hypothetical protein